MEDFLNSFIPILRRYSIEVILIVAAVISTLLSIYLSANSSRTEKDLVIKPDSKTANNQVKTVIDIQGAVVKPGIYEFTKTVRLADVVNKAQGLSQEADRDLFSRNFNLAKILSDQEKIYIPRKSDPDNSGVLTEVSGKEAGSQKLSINSAGQKELEALPGIGPVTAGKIIDGRPYDKIEDLTTNKIISQSIFEKIKGELDL